MIQGTITGGEIGNNSGRDSGGGIYNTGTLTMTGGKIDTNSSKNGGGIFNNTAGNASFTNVSVFNNTSTDTAGGGIRNIGTVSMDSSSVIDNVGNGYGAGIWNNGTLNVCGKTIVDRNKISSLSRYNLYLTSGKVITITGPLAEGASLRVAAEDNSAAITKDYGRYHEGVYPGAYFHAENRNYVVTLVDGECKLVTGNTITISPNPANALGAVSVKVNGVHAEPRVRVRTRPSMAS